MSLFGTLNFTNRKKRLLIVSLHLAGGCFYYSNNIFSRFKSKKDIFIPDEVCEENEILDSKKLKYYNHKVFVRYFSLLIFLLRIFLGGIFGFYSALILSGFTSWDYYIMKIWKFTGCPSFVVVHDGIMHSGEQNNKWQSQLKYCIKSASCLILLSNYVKKNIEKELNIFKPCIIAPHGLIDYGGFPKQYISTPPNLLFLGRGSHYKGIDILIEAIQKVKDDCYGRLKIAGELSQQVRQSLKNNNYNKEKIIIIDKWLSISQMRELLQEADIMIFPYREASQSGALTLALQYEIPHIISSSGALPEQTNSDCAIILDSLNADDLAMAISGLCQNHALLQLMKDNCKSLKKKYSWETIAANLEEKIFDKLIEFKNK